MVSFEDDCDLRKRTRTEFNRMGRKNRPPLHYKSALPTWSGITADILQIQLKNSCLMNEW
jgi:hypothetical protein